MGKRPVVVISSSDDEDGGCSVSAGCNSSRTKSERSVGRKKCRRLKKASVLNRQLCKQGHKEEEANFDALLKDFYEDFHGHSMAPGERGRRQKLGSPWADSRELWVDKYRPRSLEELAVHKKKIEEVKMWLEEWVRTSKEQFCGHVLVITGQAGVGKSATINVIASQLGAEVCEWKTPTPTLWQEYIHNANSGTHYISKLEEFETFVERVRKYSLLQSLSKDGSKRSVILLIDDLPLTNGRVAHGRLTKCLHFLAQSTQIPTVILVTEYGKAESGDNTKYSEELVLSLERAGASKVAFNPLTFNSIKKTLSRICREEQCNVPPEWIDHIAKASGGDIRHAITSLQYFCLRPDLMLPLNLSSLSITQSRGKSEDLNEMSKLIVNSDENLDYEFSLPFGRDETLTLFHALGKFLHNKRETVDCSALGRDLFTLKDRYKRFPLKMDSPERVLLQMHGQARPIADFLHENVLDFLSDEAIEDAWIVASYLSDADCLLSTSLHGQAWSPIVAGKHDPENVTQLVSASVAVRGVLFGNSHPSPSRWHAIRSPKLWQVEKLRRHNKKIMLLEKFEAYNIFSSYGMSVMATEYKPTLKRLGFRSLEDLQVCRKMTECSKMEVGVYDLLDHDEVEGGTSMESEEDEIEDW
eukprot:TRINITY_DN5312_c0_g1_i1.p1 TRINITY_DN5312_c0_g1~~TRINITY_DN5312_c0_g1_i1.p1  ORF type:complete len:641 (+),score=151.19 TRINITY_DN5312_c0_g1_i1:281-2203(+)